MALPQTIGSAPNAAASSRRACCRSSRRSPERPGRSARCGCGRCALVSESQAVAAQLGQFPGGQTQREDLAAQVTLALAGALGPTGPLRRRDRERRLAYCLTFSTWFAATPLCVSFPLPCG